MAKNDARETLKAIDEVINSTAYRENIRKMVRATSGVLLNDDEISGAIENFKTIARCEFIASYRENPALSGDAMKAVFDGKVQRAFDAVLSRCDYSWRRFSRATVSPDGNGGYCLVRPVSAA